MGFRLPEGTEIEVEDGGRRFRGDYSVMLGDLIVYYNGHTASVRKPDTDMHDTAIDMLRQLVRENYVEIDSVPSDLPQRIREAAWKYVNSFDDDEPVRNLDQVIWRSECRIGTPCPSVLALCQRDTTDCAFLERDVR